ncbi:HDOD domain-containing protein [bacterium]|nr:HDOD domain-containing protein [bacterium]
MERITTSKSTSLRRSQVIKRLRENNNLPVFPDILHRLESILEDTTRVNINQVAELIESEPVIAGRVIKLANSAYYGGGRRTLDSIPLAVNRLGYHTLRTLVYSCVLPEMFMEVKGFDHLQFWRHSLIVALLSRDLMTRSVERTLKTIDQAYLSGLMHGVGVLVFMTLVPHEYRQALQTSKESGIMLSAVEKEMFGIDHAELGSLLLESEWNMDEVVVEAVRNQYIAPETKPPRNVRETLYVANAVCLVYGISNGTGMNYESQHLDLLANIGRLKYDKETIERLLELAQDEVSTIEDFLHYHP